MRFGTPQTTPSYFNRRIQHSLLAFAGFTLTVLFGLSVAYEPFRQNDQSNFGESQRSFDGRSAASKDALNSGSFVASAQLENDGPRGQSIESNSRDRNRDVPAAQGWEPFQKRGQERSRDSDPFPRRSTVREDIDFERPDDNFEVQQNPAIEVDGNNQLLPSDFEPLDSDVADQQMDGSFDPFADSTPSRQRERTANRNRVNSDDDPGWLQDGSDQTISRNDRRLPGSSMLPGSNSLPGGNSISDDDSFPEDNVLPGGNSLPGNNALPGSNSLPDQPVDRSRGLRDGDNNSIPPAGDPINRRHRTQAPRRDFVKDNDVDSTPPATDPINQHRHTPAPRRDFDRGDLATDGIDLSDPPLNSRRSRGHTVTEPVDNEPYQSDIASVRIDKRYLDLVKDNTVGIRRDEAEVFYWLLDHARRVAPTELERAGLTEVQYINLMTEPDRFRGEPITIEGDLWALYEFDAGRNDYGLGRVYEGWVFTGDSGNHPFRVVFTSLPRGIQPGERIRKPVRITGYFFKREGYESQGTIHFAPVLLARKVKINPMPNGLSFPSGFTPHVVGVIMAMGLALLVTIIGFSISDDRSSKEQMQRMRRYPQLSFANLTAPDFTSVEECLRQLSEREHNSAIRGAYGPLLSRQTLLEHSLKSFPLQTETDLLAEQHRQADAVHNWAARQQQAQHEIDSLRTSPVMPRPQKSYDEDDLNSDHLAPARNFLPKVVKPSHPIPQSSSFSFPIPISVPAVVSPPPPPPPLPRESYSHEHTTSHKAEVLNPHPVVSQLHSVVTANPSNIDYRASKLSEWEEEVSKMQNRGHGLGSSQLTWPAFSREAVADQIERDRELREHEVEEQIHHETPHSHPHFHHHEESRVESHRNFESQVEREWAEHERQRHESDPVIHDQAQFDLADEDLPLEDEDLSSGYDYQSGTHEQTDRGHSSNKTGWNRNRKRRRNWRDGNAS